MRSSARHVRSGATRWSSWLGVVLVLALLGVFPSVAHAVGEPVLIDDFGGNARGRTVTPLPEPGESTTAPGTFTESGGRATVVATGNGNGRGGVRLDYVFPALDLTSGVSNTQFFLEFDSIQRLPVQQEGENAAEISIRVTDADGLTGTYGTAVANTGPFNIVLNFTCAQNNVCFQPQIDFTRATRIQVELRYPQNNDAVGSLTAVLDQIRTTPPGGVQPPPPTPTITAPAGNPVYARSGSVLDFPISFSSNGQPVPVSRTPVSDDGLAIEDVDLTGTAAGLASSTVTGGPSAYVLHVGPLTGSGSIVVSVPASVVVDGWGQANRASTTVRVNFVLGVPPDFTNGQPPAGQVGTPYSFAFSAGGTPTATYALASGALPPGLTLAGDGRLTGTPTTPGSYAFAVRATNSMGEDTFAVTGLVIAQLPEITSVETATFVRDQAGTFTITTTGYPAPAITTADTLPAGLDLRDNGDGTATISGTPTGRPGSTEITVTARNAAGSDTQRLTLVVQSSATFTSPAVAAFTVGQSDTFTVTTDAEPAADISVTTGTLPAGLALTPHDDGTATIAGTPTGPGGLVSVVLSATNSVGTTQQTLAITVNEAPTITSLDEATFEVGAAGSFTVTASGYPGPTFTVVNGGLPAGLALNESTGVISGTPSGPGGQTTVTVRATNTAGDDEQTLTLTVTEDPEITSSDAVRFVVGRAARFTVTTTGYPNPAITSGALPQGLTLTDGGNGTATITGTPMAATAGTTVPITAENSTGSDTEDLTITVNEAPTITSPDVVTFDRGAASTFTIAATGLPLPTISTDDDLPVGLSLGESEDGAAILSGTPTEAGSTTITVAATNEVAETTQRLEIRVTAPPAFDSPATASFRELVRGEFVITTTGFPPATLTSAGALPDGITFTDRGDGTATLSGTAAAGSAGSYPITLTASNAGGEGDRVGGAAGRVAALDVGTQTQQLTITVLAAPSPSPTASPTTTDPGDDSSDDGSGDNDGSDSSSTDDSSDGLASTGGPALWIGLIGLGLVAAGGGLWVASQRRSRHG